MRRESIKGKQFISVSIEFNCPNTYKNSLSANFKVTRNWLRENITNETNNLESLNKQGKLPSSLNTAKRFLPIFLNRVHFEYVPAIKDMAYFDDVLSRLQDSILGIKINFYPKISQMTEKLAPLIQEKIITLQEEFKRTSGIESAITPPNDFASLFQAFPVSTSLDDEHKIPLGLRGDGIQVKYLLSVLRYIFENSNDFFRPVDPTNSVANGGSGGADMLNKAIETVNPADMRKAIAIFDCDTGGIKAFTKLSKNFKKWRGHDFIKVHSNKLAFAMLLPVPPERENYANNEFLSIEFLFSDDTLQKRTDDCRGLKLKKPQPELKSKNRTIKKLNQKQISLLNFVDIWHEIVGGKKTFATEIVPNLDKIHFNSFRPMFDLLGQIINE